MVGGMFATQNKLGYWSVTRPFLLAKARQRQTSYCPSCVVQKLAYIIVHHTIRL